MGSDTIVSSVIAAITIIMTATLDCDNCLSIMTALDYQRHTCCTEETHPLDRTLGCWAHGSGVAWVESNLLLVIALGVITFIAVTVAWRGRIVSSYSPSRLWSYLSRVYG